MNSRMDYILRTDRRMFQNVAVRVPRHNKEHYMVMRCLLAVARREHQRYLRR